MTRIDVVNAPAGGSNRARGENVGDSSSVKALPGEATSLPSPRERALRVLNQLPPFSPTLNRLLATLAKEDVFFGEISSIIEKDTVLAGHVLKLVNSALYARSGTINSVRHAVAILGLNKLRNVALSLSVARMWKTASIPKGWSQAAFNLHSVATAVMADQLAQHLPVEYPEGAFTAGLLHAVGKLMIATALPEHYAEILAVYNSDGNCCMEDVEMRLIGCHHAELCQEALLHWKLPVEIQEAVGRQHDPPPSAGGKMPLARLLQAAHTLVGEIDLAFPACGAPGQRPPEATLAELGLGEQGAKILEEHKNEFNALKSFF